MTELTVALLILLSSRLFFLGENGLSIRRAVQKSLFETAAILLVFSWLHPAVIGLAVLMWGINIGHSAAEKRKGEVIEELRIVILPATFLAICVVLSPALQASIAGHWQESGELVGQYFLFPVGPWALAIFCGLLLCGKESNMAVRCLLRRLGLRPTDDRTIVEPASYRNGRVIGTLERILIFVFVLLDQFTAIAFILAAKGFTRFRDLDKRTFAEYVLIGTLSSFTLALGIAFLIRVLI